MLRFTLSSIVLCFAFTASAQRSPSQDLSATTHVALQINGDEPEGEPDWPFLAGSGGYLAGAAGGVYLSFLLVPSDSAAGDRQLPLRIAAGVAGGTLTSATAVYIANGSRGSLPLMIGGALVGQIIGVGVAGSFVLLDVVVGGILGSKEPGFSWLGMAVILGTPFYASLGASYAGDLGSTP